MTTHFTFVAFILDGLLAGADWQFWLREKLSEAGIVLSSEDDGLFWRDDLIGRYNFVECDQARSTFHDAPWLSFESVHPMLGKPVGFLSWTHAANERAARDHLVPKLMKVGRGPIIRIDNGELRRPVRMRPFSLTDVLSRHGFDDGNAFLSRDDDYFHYVLREIERVLASADLEGHVAVFGTHHNPIQLSGDLRRHGQVLADPESALKPLAVELLTYDWAIVLDELFWID